MGTLLDQSCAAVAIKNCARRESVANKKQDSMPDIARFADAADGTLAAERSFEHCADASVVRIG